MSRKVISEFRCLCEIKLSDGTSRRIQNWQAAPLNYLNKQWNYLGFDFPSLSKKIGEDAQTIQMVLPNIGSSQHGFLPIRDWCQNGILAGAYVTFYLFVDNLLTTRHVFIVAERIFEESQGSSIKINLRQPDARGATILTQKFTHAKFGELPQVAI
jgi:hypothetical protein